MSSANNSNESTTNTEKDRYVFNLANLKKGDILLSSDETKISKFIGASTNGKFSHAMLYLDNMVIHALLDGVYSKNPQRLFYSSSQNILALRLKEPLTSQQLMIIEKEARGLVGSLYSIYEAGKSKFKSQSEKSAKTQKQYCSKLVAQCYKKAGINIVKNPDYCSPNDISRSDLLVAVDDFCRPLTEDDDKIIKKHDYNLELQKATFLWLGKARDIAKNHGITIHTQNDAFAFLIKHPKHDKAIAKHIESSGYLSYYDIDRRYNSYRYSSEEFMQIIDAYDGSPSDIISTEVEINSSDWAVRLNNLQTSRKNYEKFSLDVFKMEYELQNKIVQEIYTRFSVINEVKRLLNIKTN